MTDILDNYAVREFLTSLMAGELNLVTEFTWIVIATGLSMVGGAIGGMILGGKDIGYQFSATLGALFGPAGIIPAMIVGFTVLNLLQSY